MNNKLEKKDLKNFEIGLTEARRLKITKQDLKGITEVISNEKYKIRATTGIRKQETFNGTLLNAIKRKKEIESIANTKEEKEENNDIMFFDAISLYVDELYRREARDEMDINTVYEHIRKINSDIYDFFHNYKLKQVTTEALEDFIDYLRDRDNKSNNISKQKKLSETTVSNYLVTLNAILNYLELKRKIPNNPLKYVTNKPKKRKGKNKKELTYFQIDEAKYALACLNKFANIRLKAFMSIIFSLGCRREEACGLKWKDVNFETYEVIYNEAVTSSIPNHFLEKFKNEKLKYQKEDKNYNRVRSKKLKTDNSYRTNYLSDVTIAFLRKYYKFKIACGIDVNKEDYIFTTWREGRNVNPNDIEMFDDTTPVDPNKLSMEWRNFKKEHNIKNVDLHRIRHTVANILEKKNIPKKDIAKLLGNTERVLEEYYTHVDINELKRMRNTIDTTLFNNIKYLDLDIDLVVKIINEYPMDSLSNGELTQLDNISDENIDSSNYNNVIKSIKNLIIANDNSLNYFIDEDTSSLNIKIETYKRFNNEHSIKIKKEKDISITRDILSF